jgi:hypothetical protein
MDFPRFAQNFRLWFDKLTTLSEAEGQLSYLSQI